MYIVYVHSLHGLHTLLTFNAHGQICFGGMPLERSPNYFMGVVSGCPFYGEFFIEKSPSVLSAVRNRRFSEVGFVLKL